MPVLEKLRTLSPSERRALLTAGLSLCRARLEVRLRPFRKIASSLETPEPSQPLTATETEQLEAIGWAIRALGARVPWFRNCLVQAVAAKRLLGRRGIASTLHLGVAPCIEQTSFEAHAWLEVGGRIVVGRSEQAFEALYSSP